MITFLKRLAAAVATPATGKVTLFVDNATGEPAYKDEAGTVTSLQGAVGPAGPGVPVGGTAGQRLAKIDGTDYNTEWVSDGGGGGGSAVSVLTISAGVVNIDCSLGDYFTLAMTENVTSVTFSNLPAPGQAQTIMVCPTQDATGNRTMTMPSSFDWASGTVGVLSTAANAVDVLALTTFNQGTSWIATLSKAHA